MIKAYWYKGYGYNNFSGNVGDILTPIILKYLTGEEIRHRSGEIKNGRVFACGSIVENIKDNDIVWGSGLIQPMKLEKKQNVKILAVRGKATRKALIETGYDCPEIYGDPAMLMPKIYPNEFKTFYPVSSEESYANDKLERYYDIAYIPHYIERQEYSDWFRGYQINIINEPKRFIMELLQCKKIVTSTLHGYILAKAYGIPVEYVQLTNKIIGGMYKFCDFLSGLKEYDENKFINSFKEYYEKNNSIPVATH